MFIESFLFFNILLFSGFGVEIIFGHKRSGFKSYFKVCLVNSAALLINSIVFFALKDVFFKKYLIGDEYVFILMLVFSFALNEALFTVVKHSDFNIFDSLNLVSGVMPMLFYIKQHSFYRMVSLTSGAALAFLLFSSLFFFIKRHAADNCAGADEFNIFCYEMILFGLFSASFSIFFRVV